MKIVKRLKNSISLALLSTSVLVAQSGPVLAAGPCEKVSNSQQLQTCVQQNQIVKDLQLIINVLSAGVAIVVVGMLIVGGIQYMVAGDNPQATAAAKQRIANALIALIAFMLTFAFLQWLVPGGIFS